MGDFIPPPRPHDLLPQLLACLPTAFVSPRPPPALLPLLTPILRQRVQLLSATQSGSDGWLLLLCWDAARASKLGGVVERIHVEPHPVSGEVEISDPSRISYQRLDTETLHSRFELEEFDLLAKYLWCLEDGQGNERGWKLAELQSLEDIDDDATWYGSISEANEQCGPSRSTKTNGNSLHAANGSRKEIAEPEREGADEEDDDAYWAAYDRTPGRTPSISKSSPPPPAATSVQVPSTAQLASELEYFARYMSEVQPAMDPEDPDEEALRPGESTLNGNTLVAQKKIEHEPIESSNLGSQGYDSSFPVQAALPQQTQAENEVHSPSPTSHRSGSPVDNLERRARTASSAEFGIKQHISTDIKSLYRLAKSAGIDREEFERIVRTELDVLTFMDEQ